VDTRQSSEGEQLDLIDAQQTETKEVQRKRATMEEIRRLENVLVEAKERNARNNLRWHNSARAEQAKIEQLEAEIARISSPGESRINPTLLAAIIKKSIWANNTCQGTNSSWSSPHRQPRRNVKAEPHMTQKHLYSETKIINGKKGGTIISMGWETRNCMVNE